MRYVLGLSILLLFQACADSGFLDRARKDSSILEGVQVEPQDDLASAIVLITQDFAIEKGQPLFFGICTGVIIDHNIVLTAAHCLDRGVKNMKVILNSDPRGSLSMTNDVFKPIGKAVHESYLYKKSKRPDSLEDFTSATLQNAEIYNDVALIQVDRDFPVMKPAFKNVLGPVRQDELETVVVAGFGKTLIDRDTRKTDYKLINGALKKAELNIEKKNYYKAQILIPQWNAGSGVCRGDSGAPVFVQNEKGYKLFAMAVGIAAEPDADVECGGYGVYLNLEGMKPWILKNQKKLQSSK